MIPDFPLEQTIDFKFTSRAFATGIPTTLSGTPTCEVFEDNSTTEVQTAQAPTVDFDGVTGLNNIRIVATAANGYESGKSYAVVMEAGTVGGVSVVGEVVAQFTIERSAASVDLANATDGLGTIKTETANILVDTAVIGALGAGLTAIPWNSAWDAEVQSEVADALAAFAPEIAQLVHLGGTVYFVRTDGNDGNSGLTPTLAKLTLAGAIAVATTAGDFILMAGGTYSEGTTENKLPSGVSLYGAGMHATTIQSTVDLASDTVALGLTDDNRVADLTIHCTLTDGSFQACIGARETLSPQNCSVYRCHFIGDTDAIYFSQDNCSTDFYDCVCDTLFDGTFVTGSGSLIRLFDTQIHVTGPSNEGSGVSRGATMNGNSRMEIYGGSIRVTNGGGTRTVGLESGLGTTGVITAERVRIITSGGAGSILDINQTSTNVIELYNCSYDPSKVTGTVTRAPNPQHPVPTTAADYFVDITSGGAVGIDWANVENKGSTVDLSATTVFLVDTATDVTNAVNLITATQASIDAIETDTTTDIPALIATAQADLDTITGASGVILLAATQASIDAIETDTTTDIPATITTAQADLDTITGADGVFLAVTQTAGWPTNLATSAAAIVPGACEGTPTTTVIQTDLTEATDDHYIGRVVVFTSGNASGQASDITDYTGSTGTLTVTALTTAPAATDTFVIV